LKKLSTGIQFKCTSMYDFFIPQKDFQLLRIDIHSDQIWSNWKSFWCRWIQHQLSRLHISKLKHFYQQTRFVTNYPFTTNKVHLNKVFTGSTFEKHNWKLKKFMMFKWSRIYFEIKKYDFQLIQIINSKFFNFFWRKSIQKCINGQ
jgi:hypothetical protein